MGYSCHGGSDDNPFYGRGIESRGENTCCASDCGKEKVFLIVLGMEVEGARDMANTIHIYSQLFQTVNTIKKRIECAVYLHILDHG